MDCVRSDLQTVARRHNGSQELREICDWLKKVFDYNVPNGKRIRGMIVVTTYRLLVVQQERDISEDDLELVRVLGWCVEILQAYFLVKWANYEVINGICEECRDLD